MNAENVKDLASDYRRWGKDRVKLVDEGARKWGVIFHSFCNGKEG